MLFSTCSIVIVVIVAVVSSSSNSIKMTFNPLLGFININDTPNLKKGLTTIFIVNWSRVVKSFDSILVEDDLMKRLMSDCDFLVTYKLSIMVATLRTIICVTLCVAFIATNYSAEVDFSFFEDFIKYS